MAWTRERALERIAKLMQSVPQVTTESYVDDYRPKFLAETAARAHDSLPAKRPLVDLPSTTAVMVDTVHVYANLINYDEQRLSDGRETEYSHARALAFLHLHYGACDRVIGGLSAQRVDFHGPRVHAVVVEPAGGAGAYERILTALDLAQQMQLLSELANSELQENQFPARFRIGIDAGPCVAINSGQGVEQEPLFLGGAANHAAKLAEGDKPGIFVSDRVRAALRMASVGSFERELSEALDPRFMPEYGPGPGLLSGASRAQTLNVKAQELMEEWRGDIRQQRTATGGIDRFKFHYHQPPLSSIDYADLSPSNTIRMPLMSVFADLDGYTNYIDQVMFGAGVGDAVRALHVIRGELRNVLQSDFGGRKVRFIGDCIHGLLAEGNARETDETASIRSVTRCAGALRSSFDLCREVLPGIDELGLAIGMELGPTPVTRIGIRGDRSVRVATSVATSRSETVQRGLTGTQSAIGPAAYAAAPIDIKKIFDGGGPVSDLTYDDANMLVLAEVPRVSVITSPEDRPHAEGKWPGTN